jgi:hypothetical protein
LILLNLSNYWLPAPLAALLSLITGLSIALISDRIGIRVFAERKLIYRALYFFAGLLLLGWSIFMLSLFQFVSVNLLRGLDTSIIAAACVIAVRENVPMKVFSAYNLFIRYWQSLSVFQKVLTASVVSAVVMHGVIALSPPTDADSLDYHLGAPMRILEDQSLWMDKNFLHYRLIGFGEMINMLGVASGATQLGSFIQFIALCWAMIAGSTIVGKGKSTSAALFLGLPVLLALLPSQKHQLTGIACSSACFYLIYVQGRQIKNRAYLLLMLCLAFSAGLKYNFFISGVVLIVYSQLRGIEHRKKEQILTAIVAFTVFLGPLLLYKSIYFDDPFSPMLEGLRQTPDAVVQSFRAFIRQYPDSSLVFPIGLFLPASLSEISTILGWGGIVILAALYKSVRSKAELAAIILFVLLMVLSGQKAARFYVEPYYWSLPILLVAVNKRLKGDTLSAGGIAQFFLLLPFVAFSFFTLGSGIVSDSGRIRLMTKSASFYEEAQWAKHHIPAGAVICTDIRSRALLSHEVFPIEYMYFTQFKDSAQAKYFDYLFYEKYKVTHLLLTDNGITKAVLDRYAGTLLSGPDTFKAATRNPYNRSSYRTFLFAVKARD